MLNGAKHLVKSTSGELVYELYRALQKQVVRVDDDLDEYRVLFRSSRPEEAADHFRTIEVISSNQNSNLDSVPDLSL